MTETRAAASAEGWESPQRPVLVGMDGSAGSRAALAWAADEAVSSLSDLQLVVASGPHRRFRHGRHRLEQSVEAMAAEAAAIVPAEHITTRVYDGDPEGTLLEERGDARLVVVGKSGLGTLGRLLVGSVSLAVAGRCPVPVAVVPTGWDPRAHTGAPLVVGVAPDEPHHHLLHLAFRRAQRLDAPLVAVHGWEAPSAHAADEDLLAAETTAHEHFQECMAPWRDRFPKVELQTVASSQHPALAVLEESEKGAQLVMLGRHAGNRFTGFGFGSVTRAVLHYAEVPVLVVPTDEEHGD